MLNMDNGSSNSSRKANDEVSDQFPAGLRVLVVDDDPTCLKILEKMLQNCLYRVTPCSRATIALSILRERKYGFDLVISDVHMPDMDGFKLLEHIGLEMDLPVIMMSVDDKKEVVMKGVTHGACDYLIKPVRIEAIKNIWQHVVRKRRNELKELEQSGSFEDSDRHRKTSDDADYASSGNEGSWRNSKRRKDEEDDMDERDDTSTLKKPRVVWSVELHQQFVAAVNQLGIDKAVPKKILELMNVSGLTRENVASHLQKYRLYLRRLSGVTHQSGLNFPFMGSQEANSASISSLNDLDLHFLSVSGQYPQHNLTLLPAGGLTRSPSNASIGMPLIDQRNPFSTETLKLRFGAGQEQLGNNNRSGDLLHGFPAIMEPKQLPHSNQPVQSHTNMGPKISEGLSCFNNAPTALSDTPLGNHRNSLMMHIAQSRSREQFLNEISGGHGSGIPLSIGQKIFPNEITDRVLGRNGTVINGRGTVYNPVSQGVVGFQMNMELPGNGFNLDGGISEVGRLTGFNPSYDIINEYRQSENRNWEAEPIQGNLNFSPSVSSHQGFASNGEIGHNGNASIAVKPMGSKRKESQYGNPERIPHRVKTESIPDLSCENMLLAKQFGQDDLMSVCFKQQEGAGPVETEFNYDGYPNLAQETSLFSQ